MLYYLLESSRIVPPPNYTYNIMIYDERKLSYYPEISSLQSLIKLGKIAQNNQEETGTSPSLQTQPMRPDEKPFENQTVPTKVIPTKIVQMANPGITIQTPSGYGNSQGDVSIGVGFQSRTRYGNIEDGVLGFGLGLGDSKNAIGIDLNVGIADVDEWKNGSFSFKIHKQLPEDLAWAFGVKNVATFGNPDGGTSVYTVMTKMIRVQDTPEKLMDKIYVSVGIGGGQFRTESDINHKKNSVGVFGSVAFQLGNPINAIAEWTGQDLTIGFSLAPFPKIPIVITPAFTDILGTAGDGHRFILGVGYKLKF